MNMLFYTITKRDIGKAWQDCFGSPWLSINYVGPISSWDVGTRIFLDGKTLKVGKQP